MPIFSCLCSMFVFLSHFFFLYFTDRRLLLSFPTRRSSDLAYVAAVSKSAHVVGSSSLPGCCGQHPFLWTQTDGLIDLGTLNPSDRKSTRLNSSHITISYAVFCLKKKKTSELHTPNQKYP